jgi:hypothetical protein
MNQLNPLTGGRKMMNMAKLGTVSLFKNAFFADVNPLEAPPLLGFRAIHYAHRRPTQGGTVGGTVSHFTYPQLAAAALLAVCFSVGRQLGKFGSYVIPELSLMDETRKTTLKPSASLTARGSGLFDPSKITVPCSHQVQGVRHA